MRFINEYGEIVEGILITDEEEKYLLELQEVIFNSGTTYISMRNSIDIAIKILKYFILSKRSQPAKDVIKSNYPVSVPESTTSEPLETLDSF